MRRKIWNILYIILAAAILIPAALDFLRTQSYSDSIPSGFREAYVTSVSDGDTIRLSDGTAVRLIGVNTPETSGEIELYGAEAKAYTKMMLEGRKVYLEKDTSETDAYGRLLRYVWLELPDKVNDEAIDEHLFNALLAAEGHAQPYEFPPDTRYAERIMDLARTARDAGKGLWGISRQGTTKGTYVP
ncbi:thermonuclease family protein [Youngiibacter multivorans]|uniref:Micrococcal nuclease n=1 Tax=Youngiibacter multivorans TaxID=937251 RepID=A0ABS4G1L2_9CLOT|nr:thermonuclease family protein [Youngiibacter multivorans]MBP1918433.1 micrococcal nuclease [Youngiibacter multivorans]